MSPRTPPLLVVGLATSVLLAACGSPGEGAPNRSPAPQVTRPSSTTTPHPSASTPSASPTRAPFTSSVRRIDDDLRRRMASSWHPGCPLALDDLRYVTVTYTDLGGRTRQGELVVHRQVVRDVREVFRSLYEARFPIRSMRLVDDFGGDDDASMAADNTSAFNCRRTSSGTEWSAHAYGRAIDVNPRENPYVRGDVVLPPAGRAYLDRGRHSPAMIRADGPVVAAFAAVGWTWGGAFRGLRDYQHFSQDGR